MEAETQEVAPSNSMAKMPVELTLTVGTVTLPLARLMDMTEGQHATTMSDCRVLSNRQVFAMRASKWVRPDQNPFLSWRVHLAGVRPHP